MAIYHWTCPFCGRDTTITEESVSNSSHVMAIRNSIGSSMLRSNFVVCPNPKCNKYTLSLVLSKAEFKHSTWFPVEKLQEWELIPASEAKVFPDYVPLPVRKDYEEACAIKKLSPKASATLARRCLQGMIRDFWGISKARLIDEINAIKEKVDPLTWAAIDAVRKVGNIGAHMEKDINVIVDVDPDEAAQLTGLIEVLVKDWYITRQERQERLNSIIALAGSKALAGQQTTVAVPKPTAPQPGTSSQSAND